MDDRYKAGAPGRSRKSCGHPGCSVALVRGRASFDLGFCAAHATEKRQPVAPLHDVRSAVVVSTAAFGGEAYRSMLVSLPREPWVTPGIILPVGVSA
jgi:hypothetical protein